MKRRAVIVVLAAVLATLVMAIAFLFVRVTQQTSEGHRALCTLQEERHRTVAAAQRFVEEHPNGTADFTRAEIAKGIREQRQTLHALANVTCP